eukprot:scaffold764_cov363-Pavlova_lutheri.AAC.3
MVFVPFLSMVGEMRSEVCLPSGYGLPTSGSPDCTTWNLADPRACPSSNFPWHVGNIVSEPVLWMKNTHHLRHNPVHPTARAWIVRLWA